MVRSLCHGFAGDISFWRATVRPRCAGQGLLPDGGNPHHVSRGRLAIYTAGKRRHRTRITLSHLDRNLGSRCATRAQLLVIMPDHGFGLRAGSLIHAIQMTPPTVAVSIQQCGLAMCRRCRRT